MYAKYIKRFLDIVISLCVLIVTLPIRIVIVIAIKLDSKGPFIFKQERTGKNGVNFMAYKFRTMTVETLDENGNELTHDERCTRVGNIIRKLSLDELPQLYNVLKGDMSLIGPRPWVPEYYRYFSEEQKHRCDVLPGITGLAQARGRNSINVFQKINYDIEYTKNVSFIMDIKIILGTIKTVVTEKGAEIKQEDMQCEISMLKIQ